MTTSTRSCTADAPHLAERYSRLAVSCALGGDALARWCAAKIVVLGSGNLGHPWALEACRSGAEVLVCDPDHGEEVNLGTQDVEPGRAKVETLRERAETVAPGRLQVEAIDARHLGVGRLREADLIVDTTDDPTLTFPFTLLSNALAIPLLRLAIDGSGEHELGRVACSHGGAEHACAVCSWAIEDLGRATERTPCPDQTDAERTPTLAGRALGLHIVGLGLLQAQRLLGGNGAEQALGREVIVDLDRYQLLPLALERSLECVSGHQRWELEETGLDARETTVAELFALVAEAHDDDVTLEAWAHPLFLETWCTCGSRRRAVGTAWAPTENCAACGAPTRWRTNPSRSRFNAAQARALGILDSTWASLGLPERGALVTAYAGARSPRRLLLS